MHGCCSAKEHVDPYVATDGEEGYAWRTGTEILILTTTARGPQDPEERTLIFGRHGDDFLVVGSKGGAPQCRPLVPEPVSRPRGAGAGQG